MVSSGGRPDQTRHRYPRSLPPVRGTPTSRQASDTQHRRRRTELAPSHLIAVIPEWTTATHGHPALGGHGPGLSFLGLFDLTPPLSPPSLPWFWVPTDHLAELVSFLWFSSSLAVSSHTLSAPPSPLHVPSRIVHPLSPTSTSSYGFPPPHGVSSTRPAPALHLWPSNEFHASVDMILRTTQVSSQVVLLAMLYLDRFKKSCPTPGERGSEVRVLVVALLLANKTLDDSAYTNKTWSEVSRIDLLDLNRCERE